MPKYDALLLVSYGGPEQMDDVMPFLRNVVVGRNVPEERLEAAVKHYELFDGVSPASEELRGLLSALILAFAADQEKGTDPFCGDHPSDLEGKRGQSPFSPPAIYWGNLFWHPMLEETLQQMADEGVTHALAFCTSAYGSYSSCRKYADAIEAAREKVGDAAPMIDKIKPFSTEASFLDPMADRVRKAIEQLPEEKRPDAKILFTAHSLPVAMAAKSPYVEQIEAACHAVAERLELNAWKLAWQSRTGPPTQPWLEPDAADMIREMNRGESVVVVPIGFCFEHMETVYDLDTVLRATADEAGVTFARAMTIGADPRFVQMILDLYHKYEAADTPPRCAEDCCPPK